MKKDAHQTEILFRKDKEGIILAIFPHEVADFKGNVTTYEHVGQHSAGNYRHCMDISKPATELESKSLKDELDSIGYNIKIVKRQNSKKYLEAYRKL